MTSEERFFGVVDDVYSAVHVRIYAAAGAWIALAGAGTAEGDRLSGAASDAVAEPGIGLAELADRIEGTASWTAGASEAARQIADQLNAAADASAVATERALELEAEFERAMETPAGPEEGNAAVQAADRQREERERLIREAEAVRDRLGLSIAQVRGAEVPAAPEGGEGSGGGSGGGGAGAPDAGVGAGGGSAGGHAVAAPLVQAANGSQIGAGDYPHSRVLGPEEGDFAGWVRSPNTGFLVDPASGREFDPVTSRWIDPVTGQPFGEVTEYAARLSGLGTGPGAISTGVGLGGTAAGLAGLYGGTLPPSVGHGGLPHGPVVQQAMNHLNQRATVASRFALHEAAQGGRPYTPPPGAAAHRPGTARAPGAGTRQRLSAESPTTWRRQPHEAAARLTGSPAPAPGAAKRTASRQEPKPRHGKPTDLTEDPTVWTPNRTAGRGVLGDL
ncbi:hypothetical protein [Streptomyces mayteni]